MKITETKLRRIIRRIVEQEGGEKLGSFNFKTNIKNVDAELLWANAISGRNDSPLMKAMLMATQKTDKGGKVKAGWGPGAIKDSGAGKGLKQWAEKMGHDVFVKRIESVQGKIQGSTPKINMPALEEEDGPAVADALSDSDDGNIAIDSNTVYSGNIKGFEEWWEKLSPKVRADFEKGIVPKMNGSKKDEGVNESDDGPFPATGEVMPGAPNLGTSKVAPKLKAIKGKALAYLVKGTLDGHIGDNIPVEKGEIGNSEMKPTQANILVGKSMLFAFTSPQGMPDMGGAFVTNDGSILDGHHRWSGSYIATGGAVEHNNVFKVGASFEEALPVLVSVANAIGRPNKSESRKRTGKKISASRLRQIIREELSS